MKLLEVHEYFGKNWKRMARELGFSRHVDTYWRRLGYIPIATQMKIEHRTGGALKACFDDAQS